MGLLEPHLARSLLMTTIRGAKRRGYRMRKAQEIRKMRQNQPRIEVKTRSWIDRVMLMKAKGATSVANEYPARDIADQEDRMDEPDDDVWVQSMYKEREHSISEAIKMHREMMSPTIFNYPDAPLRMRLDLNMQLEKKTRFVGNMTVMHSLPFPFSTGAGRNVIAFTKDGEESKKALDAGAEAAGGPDFVKHILRGGFSLDNIDYAVCHLDMMGELGTLRGLLKKRFPTQENGALGTDTSILVKHFKFGILYNIQKDITNEQFGVCKVVVGKLNQSDEHLESNIISIIKAVCRHRPATSKLGHFIHRAILTVPYSNEYFRIPFLEYCPELEIIEEKRDTTKKLKRAKEIM